MTSQWRNRSLGVSVIEFRVDDEIKSHIPPLREDERRGLEELLIREGCRHPLIVWQGILIDGHNRFDICERNGITYEVEEIDLPDREAAIAWIEDNQLGRRNVTADQFAYFIGRKYERTKGQRGGDRKSNCQNGSLNAEVAIAEQHGVSERTVHRAASFANDVDAIADRIGHAARTELLSGNTGATRAEVADAAEAVKETGLHFANVEDVLKFAAGQKKDSPYSSVKFTGNQEWYTPAKYIALAREVMGSIDVDPASNAIAQETIKAATFYTVDDDGLTKEWRGRGWLNPPYSQPEISQFTDKLIAEHEAGRLTEAVMLVNNVTDAAWFQRAARAARSTCFTAGRIRFLRDGIEQGSPPQGQTFFYFGANPARFAEVFADVGSTLAHMATAA